MCGTYTIIPGDKFHERFNLVNRLDVLKPHYNVKPGYMMPVISGKMLSLMKWGLIPSWAKDPAIGYKMINARAETIMEKASFSKPFTKQRCLVPASGFYEWQKTGKEKLPFYIRLKSDDLFTFAGLYDIWQDAEGKEISSYTIITTEPNPLVAPIHNRMPVILEREFEEKWLKEPAEMNKLISLLKPFPENKMEAYPVSRAVNYGENDGDELVKPVKINKQPSLF